MSIPLIFLGVLIVVFILGLIMGPPDSRHVTRDHDQPLSSTLDETSEPSEIGGRTLEKVKALRVTVDWEEGMFEVLPARLGEPIRIEADFEEGIYKLEPSFSHSGDVEEFSLRFYKTGSLSTIRQLIHMRGQDVDNHIELYLPAGVPIDLELKMRKGECRMDLSGLAIRRMDLDAAMGETRVVFKEDNPVLMKSLRLKGKMGEVVFDGLSRAGVQDLLVRGSMGEFVLDLEGPWRSDLTADVKVTMGEVVLSVPDDIHVQTENNVVMFGELDLPSSRNLRDPETSDPQRIMLFKGHVTFGGLTVR